MERVTVKGKRNLLQAIIGIAIIVLVFIANGFLSFISVGFDFENIKSPMFWAGFIILFASEIAVMLGMFIIQKLKDMKSTKITDLQKHIDKKRDTVYYLDKIDNAEDWLRNVYNYREKLTLYENKIRHIHSKIVLNEPKENSKFYKYKIKQFEKRKKKRDFCIKQLELIKKDRERLKIVVDSFKTGANCPDLTEYDELLNDNDYGFKQAKIHYKEVYWGNLLSDSEEASDKDTSPFFSEKKELSRNVLKYFAFGMMWTGILSAMTFPTLKHLGWETGLSLVLNGISLIMFMSRGSKLSNKIILGSYYKALEKRKSIYNQMLKDLGVSKIIIEDTEVEEPEAQEKHEIKG